VREMAERGGEVPLDHAAMQAVVLAGANRLGEVGPVGRALALVVLGLRERLLFPAAKGFPGGAADFEPALGAEEKIPDLLAGAAFVVRVAAAGFQLDDFAVGVFVGRRLGVGRFLRRLVVP